MRRVALCVALTAAAGATGSAQESPELPAKAQTKLRPAAPQQRRFYKGRGPGQGNAYLAPFEENYAYLRNPTRRTDFFDPLKLIPFDPAGDVYLTLNGEVRFRFRYDNTDHRNFGIATAATPAKAPGGRPAFTPAKITSSSELYKQRYALGGDFKFGPNLRFYGELYHGQQTGHDVGPAVPGAQRDELGLVNGFGEAYGVLDGAKTGLRAGRQQVYLGNDFQVRANAATNLPSPVLDGFRAYRDLGAARSTPSPPIWCAMATASCRTGTPRTSICGASTAASTCRDRSRSATPAGPRSTCSTWAGAPAGSAPPEVDPDHETAGAVL